MIKFRRYPDITNSYDENKVKSFLMARANDFEFGCFRKIDGSNFQIVVDRNGDIKFGNRSCYLGETAEFRNFKEVMNRYGIKEKMLRMFDIVKKIKKTSNIIDKVDSICLFGELLGGYYKCKEVSRDSLAVPVQKRISYSPRNEFIAFDLRLNFEDPMNDVYLGADYLDKICKLLDIPCQICEFNGTFMECLDFDFSNINDNTGAILFGYPEVKDQIIEGVVIKPMFDDLRVKYRKRIILKSKNEKFKERQHKKQRKIQDLTEKEQKWFDILNEYMNENRVMSAVSKVGKDNFGLLIRESIADALEDFKKDNGDNIDLTKDEYKIVCKHFSRGAVEIVRKVYLS